MATEGKRKLSSYQRFMSDCLKSKTGNGGLDRSEMTKAMKECVEEWNSNKEEIKKKYENDNENQ